MGESLEEVLPILCGGRDIGTYTPHPIPEQGDFR